MYSYSNYSNNNSSLNNYYQRNLRNNKTVAKIIQPIFLAIMIIAKNDTKEVLLIKITIDLLLKNS